MGKRMIFQARGRGSMTYRAHSHRWLGKVIYPVVKKEETKQGIIVDILHDPGRNAPVALVRFDDGRKRLFYVQEGAAVGDSIEVGEKAVARPGNVLSLSKVPDGTSIFNIEASPFDGGKFARSSGTFGVVVAHAPGKATVLLPSKKTIELDERCLATIGVSAGGDRKIKPFVKAGNKYHAMRARGKLYPLVSGRSMNVVDHKFGGSHLGIPKTVSRNAPPGRKVGSIAARRTGRKKR